MRDVLLAILDCSRVRWNLFVTAMWQHGVGAWAEACATKSAIKSKNASETLALRNTKPHAYLLDIVRGV